MSFTPEQLAERRAGLGASDAPSAVGLSRWCSPLELYLRKIGEAPAQAETWPMRVGSALEPLVLAGFTAETGLAVTDQQRRFIDPARPWRWATVDGIASDGALVEAKTSASPAEWGDDEDSIPVEYTCQVQHALAVTGLTLAYVPVLIATRELRVYRVPRDEELIELLTERERAFWSMVESRTPPEPKTLEEMRLRWPRDDGTARVATTEVLAALLDYRREREEAARHEALAEDAKARVLAALGEAASLVDESGRTLVTYKTSKSSRRFDVDALKSEHPELYARFQKDTPGSRRFLVKEIPL